MNYVIGSGPAGISAAMALCEKGKPVTLLDAGLQLEDNKQSQLNEISQQDPSQWDPTVINSYRKQTRAHPKEMPEKKSYGSDFHHRHVDDYVLEKGEKLSFYSSLALGGQSNVWGAALLPYSEKDLQGWPIGVSDLKPFYEKIMKSLPISATQDQLAELYPLYTDSYSPLSLSRQASDFLSDMEASADQLNSSGFSFGASRLAVQAKANGKHSGCVYCGLCLYGCPYSLIYCSSHTLMELEKNPNFTYKPNILVQKIKDSEDGVSIRATTLSNGEPCEFKGKRVFVAAGAIGSTRLILKSLDEFQEKIPLRTSQHFYLPLLRKKRTKGVVKEKLHTLSQLFLGQYSNDDGQENSHLQIYTYNDLMLGEIKNKLGILYNLGKPLIENYFLDKLLLIQGYLHSSKSYSMMVQLDSNSDRLKIESKANPETKNKISEICRSLSQIKNELKASAVYSQLSISPVGSGGHIGGSFPMKENPSEFESDVMGRVKGFHRVHLVDGSVFPTIPATTITLTIMANAYRIASKVGQG